MPCEMYVSKGELCNGYDSGSEIYSTALLVNKGDIVLRPGLLLNYGTVDNAKVGAHVYSAASPDAIIPIEPDPAAPTVVTKRITRNPPDTSTVENHGMMINSAKVASASVELLDNTAFGALTSPGDSPELFDFKNYGVSGDHLDQVRGLQAWRCEQQQLR